MYVLGTTVCRLRTVYCCETVTVGSSSDNSWAGLARLCNNNAGGLSLYHSWFNPSSRLLLLLLMSLLLYVDSRVLADE